MFGGSFVLRKLISLIILLLLVAGGMYLMGLFTDKPPVEVLKLDNIIRRGPVPGPGQELNAKGIEELNAGHLAEAVNALRGASRLEPENQVIKRNLSIALSRRANEQIDDEKAAMDLLNESLQIWPKNPEGLDGLTTLYFKARKYENALKYALVLKEIMPERTDLADFVDHLEERIANERGMSAETGDNFRLLYSDEKRLEYGGELLSILQTQLDSLTVSLGIFPDKAIDVLLLTDDLGSRADPLDPFLEGLYDGQIRLFLGDGIEDKEKMINTVRHEMVHALLHQVAGDLPGWIQEGLAQKAGEDPAESYLNELKNYLAFSIKEGEKIDISKLDTSFIMMNEQDRSKAYAASLLFMDYLTRAYGDSFISRFVAELASGKSPDSSLETVTGLSFTRLQTAFIRDLEGTI